MSLDTSLSLFSWDVAGGTLVDEHRVGALEPGKAPPRKGMVPVLEDGAAEEEPTAEPADIRDGEADLGSGWHR